MKIRDFCLSAGWYPREAGEIRRFLADFTPGEGSARAAVSPHAGWFFSGRTAARAVASLDSKAETLAVLGGHLPAGAPPLFALEDAVQTPLGIMPIDTELRDRMRAELASSRTSGAAFGEDRFADNTVEVLLPLARFFFPDAKLLWARLPAEISSFKAGKALAATANRLGRKINVLASTDLTHYGRNYGFSPKGGGRAALDWVRNVNDANFIAAVEAGSAQAVLERAERDFSSCSAGAVLGAMGFAEEEALAPARLLEYCTSADALPDEEPDSFVGYAAFAFDRVTH
jgi:AmmeMemoRadiSam system protein B